MRQFYWRGRTWIGLDMGRSQERSFRRQFRKLLRTEDETARLDRLLWDERISAARRQMRHVTKDYRALAEARIRLIQSRGGRRLGDRSRARASH